MSGYSSSDESRHSIDFVSYRRLERASEIAEDCPVTTVTRTSASRARVSSSRGSGKHNITRILSSVKREEAKKGRIPSVPLFESTSSSHQDCSSSRHTPSSKVPKKLPLTSKGDGSIA
ncbi:uncharacterized protein G2W53_039668 [Senna tora]|uniref:Uncharacterized protein n=1 Tax=Senna tora TaxID=362788 RepID=A0A834SPW9_9FABA|nr:uncharacterized protein G2W53_039668 [Senna tora]